MRGILKEYFKNTVKKMHVKVQAENKSRFEAWANKEKSTNVVKWSTVTPSSPKVISSADNIIDDSVTNETKNVTKNLTNALSKSFDIKGLASNWGNKQSSVTIKEFFQPKDLSGKINLFTTVGLVVTITGIIVANLITTTGYSILVDNKIVANVESKELADRAINEFIQDKKELYKADIKTLEKIEVQEGEVKEISLDSLKKVKQKLERKVHIVTDAIGIKVNGNTEIVVKDKNDGEQVLKRLSQPTGMKVLMASAPLTRFREKVELINIQANPKEIVTADKALKIIINGKNKIVTYKVVKGDTLWTIARANDIHVKDLRIANPVLKGEHLKIGQVLNLTKIEPIINVETMMTATVTELVPFETKVNRVSSLMRGKRKVLQEGTNGSRKVTYELVLLNGQPIKKKIINAVVLKPAKAKVVNVGTKLILASRGGGNLAWPIRGLITSGFGYRWGRMHTGLDIDGNTGNPVGAAEGGRVVTAGWYYEYGKAVIIDHGNGIRTLYGHLSSIDVHVGQSVDRGQFIGRVGNTGRSYGSHLHFEVIINGNHVNPLRYL